MGRRAKSHSQLARCGAAHEDKQMHAHAGKSAQGVNPARGQAKRGGDCAAKHPHQAGTRWMGAFGGHACKEQSTGSLPFLPHNCHAGGCCMAWPSKLCTRSAPTGVGELVCVRSVLSNSDSNPGTPGHCMPLTACSWHSVVR